MKKIEFMRLWDLYHGILTPTQQEITDLYFNLDLTLSEIAESKGISRQGVSECLNKCKKQLEEYEQKLRFSKMLDEGDLLTSFILTEVNRWSADFLQKHPEYSQDISDLLNSINKDYSPEIQKILENKGTK